MKRVGSTITALSLLAVMLTGCYCGPECKAAKESALAGCTDGLIDHCHAINRDFPQGDWDEGCRKQGDWAKCLVDGGGCVSPYRKEALRKWFYNINAKHCTGSRTITDEVL